jgi:hypothetical protein
LPDQVILSERRIVDGTAIDSPRASVSACVIRRRHSPLPGASALARLLIFVVVSLLISRRAMCPNPLFPGLVYKIIDSIYGMLVFILTMLFTSGLARDLSRKS